MRVAFDYHLIVAYNVYVHVPVNVEYSLCSFVVMVVVMFRYHREAPRVAARHRRRHQAARQAGSRRGVRPFRCRHCRCVLRVVRVQNLHNHVVCMQTHSLTGSACVYAVCCYLSFMTDKSGEEGDLLDRAIAEASSGGGGGGGGLGQFVADGPGSASDLPSLSRDDISKFTMERVHSNPPAGTYMYTYMCMYTSCRACAWQKSLAWV